MNSNDKNGIMAAVVFTIALLAFAVPAAGGELEPPVPPGTPTMKPIDQVEPRRPIYGHMLPLTITEPGSSWYLAENIATSGAGITVNADDVTIDLMGFALEGGTGIGIRDDRGGGGSPHVENVSVRNGTVRGWADQGIRLWTHSSVVDVRAVRNDGTGIELDDHSVVSGSIAASNGVHGIVVGGRAIVRDCVATHNSENGIWSLGASVIVNNVVDNNSRNGIRVSHACLVKDNEVRGNSLTMTPDFSGIWVTSNDNRIEGNLVVENAHGLTIDGDDNVVVRNSALDNLTDSYRIDAGATGNLIGTIRTSLTSAGPWDNLCIGPCP